jgi:hypothetical protein
MHHQMLPTSSRILNKFNPRDIPALQSDWPTAFGTEH